MFIIMILCVLPTLSVAEDSEAKLALTNKAKLSCQLGKIPQIHANPNGKELSVANPILFLP
jgi:hypothetical protein